jgi:hypothetical protein
MMQLAMAADAVGVVAMLGPNGLTTTQPQLTLSTVGSMSASGGPLTYSVRSINGSASIVNGNTANPQVQFAGGPGTYVFELTVTDANGNSSKDVATIFYQGR